MKEPLGLPAGSVRALMSLAFVGVTVYLFGIQAAVPTELLTLLGVVLTFYFTSRTAATPAQAASAADEGPLPDVYVPGAED